MLGTLIKMAALNMTRNRKRSLLTLAGIAMGVCGAMLFYGYVQQAYWGLGEGFIQSGHGHIQLAAKGWFQSAHPDTLRRPAKEFQSILDDLPQAPTPHAPINAVTLKRHFGGLISTGEASEVFVGSGVNVLGFNKMSPWVKILQGEPLSQNDSYGILVGELLAQKLRLKVGDSALLLATTDTNGRQNAIDVTIRGITRFGAKAADAVTLVMPLEGALKLVDSDLVDQAIFGLINTEKTDSAYTSIQKNLQEHPTLKGHWDVKKWHEVAEFYNGVKALFNRIFGVVAVILFVVTLMGVTNTVVMAVNERRQEIGILRAMGTPRTLIRGLFLLEGVIMGLLGSAVGLFMAWLTAQFVKLSGGIPMPPPPGSSTGYMLQFYLDIWGGLGIMALTLLSCALAAVLPSQQAAKQNIASVLSGFAWLFGVLLPLCAGVLNQGAWAAGPRSEKNRSTSSAPLPLPATEVLKRVDALRPIPGGGFQTQSTFAELDANGAPQSGKSIVWRIGGKAEKILAVAVSDPPEKRTHILTSGKGMWMHIEGVSKSVRVSPAQRMMGNASNGDVVTVQYSTDYDALKYEGDGRSPGTLLLKPKANSTQAAYGKIEMIVQGETGIIHSARFFAQSGKLLKTATYQYERLRNKFLLRGMIISDAIKTQSKTRVTFGEAKARTFDDLFFHEEAMLSSGRELLAGSL